MTRTFAVLLCMLLVPVSLPASNARDYVPLPPDTTLVCMYVSHVFGDDLYVDHDKIASNMNFEATIGILRPIHYMMLGPFLIDPQAIIPVGDISLNGEHSTGVGDITLAATIWFIDDKESRFFWAYTPFLTLPTGAYDRDNAVNMGANRWSTKQETCLGKGFGDSVWLEWVTGVEFYGENDDASGDVTLNKDPVLTSEVHLSYNFTKTVFGSVDYYLTYGGETELDGRDQDDRTTTHSLGCSLASMLTGNCQLLLDYKRDISVTNGIRTDALQARLGFVF